MFIHGSPKTFRIFAPMDLDRSYWEDRYHGGEIGWDLGGPSTPLKEYLDQLTDKDLKILIPGGGRAWEAEYAHRQGFRNVYVIDLTDAPFKDLLSRCPDFPKEHLLVGDFFQHEGTYDRILEQTFFCALDPGLRERYVAHMHKLLKPGGKLVGVLFHDTLNTDRPPFGGFAADYTPLFAAWFDRYSLEPCHNSIPPRAGRELWLVAVKEPADPPVACAFYDALEAAAVQRRTQHFVLHDGTTLQGRIIDLYLEQGREWLRLTDGRCLRLSRIAKHRDDQVPGEALAAST
jgi:SAM-dependent methyltransferase